jgi:hypothetical protein
MAGGKFKKLLKSVLPIAAGFLGGPMLGAAAKGIVGLMDAKDANKAAKQQAAQPGIPSLMGGMGGGGGQEAATAVAPQAYNPVSTSVNPYADVAPAPSMQAQGLRSLAPSQADYGQNEQAMFNAPQRQEEPDQQEYAYGGPIYLAHGGIAGLQQHEYAAGGRYLSGPGDGMSDNIKANIEGKQEARLADGEFVIPADVVSHIGNGSSNAGAKKLHAMMERIRHARTGNPKQGKQIKPEKYLPA